MEILTPRTTRRSTRLRVEIPLTVTSLDRVHPFSAKCVALVVSPQGCGFRASQALPVETPVLLSDLPGGGSASAHVANCLPLGSDGKQFLIGVSLYNHGNVFRIAASGQETVLYDFCQQPNCTDGSAPFSGLISDEAGNLYGTTEFGGANGLGVVFEVTP